MQVFCLNPPFQALIHPVVHACGDLVAIACRLSPWPTYRPLPCRSPYVRASFRFSPPFMDLFRAFGAASFLPTLPEQGLHAVRAARFAGRIGMLLFPVGEFSLFLTARKDRIRENLVFDKKKSAGQKLPGSKKWPANGKPYLYQRV